MRKVTVLLIVFLSSIFLFSQSIKVISPHSKSDWIKGRSYDIEWNHFGPMNPKVKINIFKNSINQSNFVEQIVTANSGKKKWFIKNGYSSGIYFIRIKTAAGKVIFGDSAPFKISDPGQNQNILKVDPNIFNNKTVMNRFPQVNKKLFLIKPVIGVYEPKKGVVLKQNQSVDIKWKFSGVMANMIKIYALFQNTGAQYLISPNTLNDGYFRWDLRKASWNPGKYRVRVQAINGSLKGDSEIFFIASPSASNPGLTKLRNDFLILINKYRKSKGKNMLVLDACLNSVAQDHSEWMKITGKFDHTGKNGSSPWSRCSGGGCSCDAENIHYGSSSALGCFTSWKNSPGHNANMLGFHTKLGIGMSGGYWTADFK